MVAVHRSQPALIFNPDSSYQPDTAPPPHHTDMAEPADLQKLDKILKTMPTLMTMISDTLRSLYAENELPKNKNTREFHRLETKIPRNMLFNILLNMLR
jgi:hypothetical protein